MVDMGEYTTDQTKKGWLTAILELGAWLGTLLSGFLAEVLSRKYGVLVATTVFIVGVVIQATAVTVGPDAILAGRFIT
jgi:MFS family permease